MKNMWRKFLIWIGYLCECGGELEDHPDYHKVICKECGKTFKC